VQALLQQSGPEPSISDDPGTRAAIMSKHPSARTPIEPSPDDADLFRAAVGPIRRLDDNERSDSRRPAPLPVPAQFLRDEAKVVDELLASPIDAGSADVGEELSHLREGYDPRLLKRLRRGLFAVQDTIDLHQLNLASARSVIRDFMTQTRQRGLRCVKIVHGKGLRSRNGPVLKILVERTLRQNGSVIAFASARAQDGGTGATLVLLKSG
jgi:DNA-nicking Smr family endonuclease